MNHYKLLRTIEEMYALPPLGHAAENGPALRAFATASANVASSAPYRPVADLFSEVPVDGGAELQSTAALMWAPLTR